MVCSIVCCESPCLLGKFGKLSEVNPLFFASLYSINRHDTAPILHWWLYKGCNVILDRCLCLALVLSEPSLT